MMRLRLFSPPAHHPAPIASGGLVLRFPTGDDYAQWRRLRSESTGFLTPWEPRWPADDLTRAGYRRRLARYQSEAAAGTGYTYFLFSAGGELLGGLSLSNLRMGAARSGSLGYWMGQKHAGHGHMKRAVAMILPQAFGAMALERVEAGCIPDNARSVRLLEGLGFKREGLMRGYLEIDGRRRDHLLYAMLREDFEQLWPAGAGSGAWAAGDGAAARVRPTAPTR
ncbi:MAG: ribosomal-protein-alanine N-acetyltransferase [Alphaproteobacteria bacterium]|nr:MAG: ribosomal-protein-alanine N-acetyltransferase [Alphaproteobacteria bacterium]